ncbi:hypothetical protein BKA70DRAFT_1517812 [Coprinopsis sp. MPI-PUGE-AT-0042]|nr:hypothetical protein BKA70DRAFT_1517812 [Coprinopsis sp. MPI-PUGE-AT-0042]
MTDIFIRHVFNKSVLQGSEQHKHLFRDHPAAVQECIAEALAFPEDEMLNDNVLNEASWTYAVNECWKLLNIASLYVRKVEDENNLEDLEVESLFDELVTNHSKLEIGSGDGPLGYSRAKDPISTSMSINPKSDSRGGPHFTCKYDACGSICLQKFFAIHTNSDIQMHEHANQGTGVPVVCLWAENNGSIIFLRILIFTLMSFSAIFLYHLGNRSRAGVPLVSHNNRWGQVDKKFANDLIQNPDLVELGLRALKLYHYRRASKDTGSVGKNIEEFLGRLSVRGKPLFDQKTMLVCGWPGCKQVYAAKYCVTHFDLFHANPNEVACQHKHCECRVGPLFLPAHLIMRHSQFAC